MITGPELLRFQTKYDEQPSGCWVWNGPLDKDGYGTFYLRRRNRRAHRVGWFTVRGEIPEGMVVDHICGLRSCVNPSHLRLQTARENALINSRGIGAVNAQKTHCKNGHPLDRHYGRQRYCSTCDREKGRRLRRKWAAEDTLRV